MLSPLILHMVREEGLICKISCLIPTLSGRIYNFTNFSLRLFVAVTVCLSVFLSACVSLSVHPSVSVSFRSSVCLLMAFLINWSLVSCDFFCVKLEDLKDKYNPLKSNFSQNLVFYFLKKIQSFFFHLNLHKDLIKFFFYLNYPF